MSDLDAVAESDPAWAADVARDRALSNEQLAREVADLAADGRPIYGTLLGLLNRVRPQTPAGLDVEALKTAIARTIIGPRKEMPPTSPYPLAQLQEIRWGMADANERNDARGAAAAIVERHILPLLREAAPATGPTPEPVEPEWVARIFALPQGGRETVSDANVSLSVLIAPHALEARLNPVQIVGWRVSGTDRTRDRLRAMLKALFAGAERHQRPIEMGVWDQAWAGSSGYVDPVHGLEGYVREMESLGFHRLIHPTGTTPVPLAHFPLGLDLPFDGAHRNLARAALGLDDQRGQIRRNAFMAAQGTGSYALWMEMRASGYARKSDDVAGRAYFWLTAKGAEAALNPGETLPWETVPDDAVLD